MTLTAETAIPQKKFHLILIFFPFCCRRKWTVHTLLFAVFLKLLSPNYCHLWPWGGSWLTHWVLSNGFDPLLWLQPSVSVGIVMTEERPLVPPPIPSLSPCVHQLWTTVIWYQPFVHSTSQPSFCSRLHNLADDENRIKRINIYLERENEPCTNKYYVAVSLLS